MTGARYFAYGSNLLTARLRARCPSALPRSVACAEGWDIAFTKPGNDGSGKATIVRAAGNRVWGVIYTLAETDMARLDAFEGPGYERIPLSVRLPDETVTEALTYIAPEDGLEPSRRPYDWYLALILAGAHEHGLPADHIGRIAAIFALDDPDTNRRTRVEALRLLESHGATDR